MDRADAIARLSRALHDYVLLGDVVTNLAFLRDLCQHPAFGAGETTTAFIDHHLSNWQETMPPPSDLVLIAAAVAERLERSAQPTTPAALATGDPYTPWQGLNDFRLGVTGG
jgi:acetyl/propionyl-CoA carboxylase alpha subunit